MSEKFTSVDQALSIIGPHLRADLDESRASAYGISSYDQIIALPPEEGVEKSIQALMAIPRENPLDESSYWHMQYRAAGRQLLWAIMQHRVEKGEADLPINPEDLSKVYDWKRLQPIMDRGGRILEIASSLLNQTSIQ